MAKVIIKSEKLTPFGGIFSVMEHFDALLSKTIDSSLGLRCTSYGCQYSEIIRSLLCIYFCGGFCVENVSARPMQHLSLHPRFRICSADTILRAIKELTAENVSYTSDSEKAYELNTADRLNDLLLDTLLATSGLRTDESYILDLDHQFIETEKYDAKPTYKRFTGYSPGGAVIDDVIVGIENRDGNVNVRFHQQDTLQRIFERLSSKGIHISRFRADCGSCSEEIVRMVERHCNHFYIRANRCGSLYDDLLALCG